MGENSREVRLAQVNIVVSDMERSRAFYRLLGLETSDMPPPWNAHHRTVTNLAAEVTVEFDSAASVVNWASDWSGGTGVVIGFVVESDEDVDAAVALLAREGHRVIQQPHDACRPAWWTMAKPAERRTVGSMKRLVQRLLSRASHRSMGHRRRVDLAMVCNVGFRRPGRRVGTGSVAQRRRGDSSRLTMAQRRGRDTLGVG